MFTPPLLINIAHLFLEKGMIEKIEKNLPPVFSPLFWEIQHLLYKIRENNWLKICVRSSDHWVLAHGPNNKLGSHTVTNFALPQKISGPMVQGTKNKNSQRSSREKIRTPWYFRPPASFDPTHFPECGHSLLGGTAHIWRKNRRRTPEAELA